MNKEYCVEVETTENATLTVSTEDIRGAYVYETEGHEHYEAYIFGVWFSVTRKSYDRIKKLIENRR